MLIRRTVVPAALLLALSAGCANNTQTPIDAGGPIPESAIASPAAPTVSVSAAPGETTLTGTVTAGVEPNCLLLKDGTGDHLLITEDAKLKSALQPGAEVTVVGKSEPGMMTTCMQGKPFVVSSVAAG
ncbi:hypothetical protein Q0Z83_076160 [Actinoplanes sichuanensis]|uniref:DUF5666 domain-containing protein n=1 Tax=Actinoplanes sichuanensis TaxID=512349 RepID=A0ABW4A813_9ACTN|nr:hypothetical protein [Actinoplanes sichuanensis]BEL09425.1 hypothetical protein Q0Z83_076160 [Actinoplanes sichuanensis]